MSRPLIDVMEPVTETFFCVPAPTTTTSLSDGIFTLSTPRSPTTSVWVLNPMQENTSSVLSVTSISYFPSMSVVVHIPVSPFTCTVAPGRVSPLPASVTVPTSFRLSRTFPPEFFAVSFFSEIWLPLISYFTSVPLKILSRMTLTGSFFTIMLTVLPVSMSVFP